MLWTIYGTEKRAGQFTNPENVIFIIKINESVAHTTFIVARQALAATFCSCFKLQIDRFNGRRYPILKVQIAQLVDTVVWSWIRWLQRPCKRALKQLLFLACRIKAKSNDYFNDYLIRIRILAPFSSPSRNKEAYSTHRKESFLMICIANYYGPRYNLSVHLLTLHSISMSYLIVYDEIPPFNVANRISHSHRALHVIACICLIDSQCGTSNFSYK